MYAPTLFLMFLSLLLGKEGRCGNVVFLVGDNGTVVCTTRERQNSANRTDPWTHS